MTNMAFVSGTFGWIAFAASAPFLSATMIQGVVALHHESYGVERWQGTLIYWALIAMGTAINIWGSRLLSIVETISLVVHICAFIAIFAVMWACTPAKHSADFVFATFLNSSGWSSSGVAWSIGMLSSCYVLAGTWWISAPFDPAVNTNRIRRSNSSWRGNE